MRQRGAIRQTGLTRTGRGRLFSTVAGAALMLAAPQALAADPPEPFVVPDPFVAPLVPKWHPWAELGAYWGSDRNSRGEATLWAPLFQSPDSLLFADVRGRLFEKSVREGNLALGWRQMTPAGWNWGVWTGIDARRTRAGNTFWQWSGGVEALAPNWDLRVNAYLPFDRRKRVSRTEAVVGNGEPEVVLTNDQILMVSGEDRVTTIVDELALHGFDAEAGVRLFGTDPDAPGPRHEFRLYGGGFWFDHRDLSRSLAGPMARAEWRIDDALGLAGSRLTLEAAFSYDNVRKDRWEAGARFRIPLGGARPEPAVAGLPLTPQERRMAERVERQTAVLTQEVVEETVALERVEEQVADALTDVRFDRVVFVNPSITDTSADAGPNSLLIADGVTILGPQELEGDQTLQGGGSTIDVVGVQTGTVMPFTAPGDQPTLADPGDAPNLTFLGSNTHVAGIAVEGAGQASGFNDNHGILVGSDRQNMFIGLSEISEVGREGIDIINRNEVTIYRTDIRNTGDDAIDITGDDNVVTITEVNTTDTDDEGIDVNGFRNRVSVSDVTITNAGDHGMEIDSQFNVVDIERLTITNTVSQGLDIDDDHEVTIRDLTIINAGINGIRIRNRNTVDIVGAEIRESGDNGILIEDSNRVNLSDLTITDTDRAGIDIRTGNTVNITGATLSGTDFGIDIRSDNTVNIADTTITNADDTAIFFGSRNQGEVRNVTIEDMNFTGIEFLRNNEVTIVDTRISNVQDGRGIDFLDGGNEVTIRNTTIENVEREGIRIQTGFPTGNEVEIVDSTVQDTDLDGIRMGDNHRVVISGSTISNVGEHGINMGADNIVTINPSEISNTGEDGIHIRGDGNTLEVTDSAIRNTGDDGIDISSDDNIVTVQGTTFENIDDDGIDTLRGSDNEVTVTDTTFTGVEDHPITMGSNNTYVVTGVTIDGAGRSGIRMDGNNNVTIEDSVLTGAFAEDGIHINGPGNTFAGDGNMAANATFGGQFCFDRFPGTHVGAIDFDDDGTGDPATCP